MKNTLSFIPLVICFFLLIGYNFMSAQWSAPTDTPPNGNTPAPINLGPDTQAKSGNFMANIVAAATSTWSPRYCDELGANCWDPASGAPGGNSSSSLPACQNGESLVMNGSSWQCDAPDEIRTLSTPVRILTHTGGNTTWTYNTNTLAGNVKDINVNITRDDRTCGSGESRTWHIITFQTYRIEPQLNSGTWAQTNSSRNVPFTIERRQSGSLCPVSSTIDLIGYRCDGNCQ